MSNQLIQQIADEIQSIKSAMVTKDDMEHMATKQDLESFATKQDLEPLANKQDVGILATKLDELNEKVDTNTTLINSMSHQVVRNSEQLSDLVASKKRQERILEILSLRSIEHESELQE